MRNFSVRFETAQHIPPPFCNHYQFDISTNNSDLLEVNFSIKYHHRDEISLDEIYDEGFTENDDFEWKGQLDKAWTLVFSSIIEELKLSKSINFAADANLFEVKLDEVWSQVENQIRFELFFQEAIQGVFETAQRELPLMITFLELDSNSLKKEVDLKVSFLERKVSLNYGAKSTNLDWNELNNHIQTIYDCDFIEEQASRKKPTKVGRYLNIGDGSWYQFGKSLQNPKGMPNTLETVYKFFNIEI